MSALVVPIGHRLGARHGESGRVHQVRLGASAVDLDDEAFELWMRAHEVPGPARSPSYEQSLAAGLLAEVVPGSSGAAEFAAAHRLLPLALSLGHTYDEPDLFALGLRDRPLVNVTGPVYDLWQWAHLSPDLWSACQETAGIANAAGIGSGTDPHNLLTSLLGSLHTLLAARVACVDVR